MELKKNPKKDLNQHIGIYFATGMLLVLTLTYVALEWKSFYMPDFVAEVQTQEELREETPPLTFVTPPPPPTPIAPSIIEIAPDDPEIIETIMASTEAGEDIVILTIDEIEVGEVEEDLPISFIVVEEVPVFPGCENDSDKRACFNKMMKKHIIKNFHYPEVEQELGIQGKVNIMFEIQKDGSISNIRMRGPNKNLENDAARIIGKLPKMTPGKQRGNPVRVPFSIPITYKLHN
jgi:protein TonB